MRKILVVGFIALFLLACGGDDTPEVASEGSWSYRRSPLSGICYEVYKFEEGITDQQTGFMGINEVDSFHCD
jgi:hypothetical protein